MLLDSVGSELTKQLLLWRCLHKDAQSYAANGPAANTVKGLIEPMRDRPSGPPSNPGLRAHQSFQLGVPGIDYLPSNITSILNYSRVGRHHLSRPRWRALNSHGHTGLKGGPRWRTSRKLHQWTQSL